MKNYDEITNNLLERRNQYEAERQKRKTVMKRTVTPVCCLCLAVLIGIGLQQSGLHRILGGIFGAKPPVEPDNPTLVGENVTNDDKDGTAMGADVTSGQWYGPGQEEPPTDSTGSSTSESNGTGEDATKRMFYVNEIKSTVSAATKYRDPALHYNEIWDFAKASAYLGIDIPKVIENFPDGNAESGFPETLDFKYVAANGFEVIYKNDGTLAEDSMCYEFIGKNNTKIMILASKLGSPYDYLYSSDTDDITNIRIPATDEIIPVCVYAQGKTANSDYTLYVGDFEYKGVFYRLRLENLNAKYLDALIREIVKQFV